MAWTEKDIRELAERQHAFFRSGATLDVKWRKEQLKKLRDAIIERREQLEAALEADLGRCGEEAFLCDIGPTIMEINEILRGMGRWAKPEVHFSGFVCFPSLVTRVYKLPYGVTLLISPYNFPVLLTLGVLAASLSAGNTAIIKTSSKSPACTRVMQEMLASIYPLEYCQLVDGGHDVADWCLEQRVDKIFYTGSPAVAKHVLEMAAKNLTPVALELGGENGNWCIVRKDADLQDAARKIAFFKLCNSGQICIEINQVAVAEEVAEEFLTLLRREFIRQIGENAPENPEYARLISAAAYERCAEEAEQYRERIIFGGYGNKDKLRYAPTIIYPVGAEEPIVRHELFCPLLPVVPFPDAQVEKILETIAGREHPLAMYLFTADLPWARKVMGRMQYGGGCINEVCIHLMVRGVPFNGTGHAGMGAYHGIWGFREFTHPSTVLEGSSRFNLPLREHPFRGNKWKKKLMELFER